MSNLVAIRMEERAVFDATHELVLRRRRALLEALRARIPTGDDARTDLADVCAELLEPWTDGRIKLYLTHRALTLRRRRAGLFDVGEYRALTPGDRHAGVYRDRFTSLRVASERREDGAVLSAPALFGRFPVALLEREGREP